MKKLRIHFLTIIIYSSFLIAHISYANSFNPLIEAINQDNEAAIYSILKSGNLVNSKGEFQVTPLMSSIYKKNEKITKLLLNLGADVDSVDIGGASALHIAARIANTNLVNMLLDNNASVNLQDSDGWTPLMRAVGTNNIEIVKSIVGKNSDLKLLNKSNQSIFTLALLHNNIEAVKYFAEHDLLPVDKTQCDILVKLAKDRNLLEIETILSEKFTHPTVVKSNIQISEPLILNPTEAGSIKSNSVVDNIAQEDLMVLNEGELVQQQEVIELDWLEGHIRNEYVDYSDIGNIEDHIKQAVIAENLQIPTENTAKSRNFEGDMNIDTDRELAWLADSSKNSKDVELVQNENENYSGEINLDSELAPIKNIQYVDSQIKTNKSIINKDESKLQFSRNIWIEIDQSNFITKLENEEIEKLAISNGMRVRSNKSIDKDHSFIQVGPINDNFIIDDLAKLINIPKENLRIVTILDQNRYK